MHDHGRAEVVDPVIVLTVVAQQADLLHGRLLGFTRGHGATGFLCPVVLEHAGCRLDYVPGCLLLATIQIGADLLNHQHAEDEQHEDGDHGDQPETLANGNVSQQIHE